jgi:predicted acyltransferase
MQTLTSSDKTLQDKTASPRFLSLDVFRGLTVAGMILVNNPGSWEHVYAPLRHAPWNGCTPTDLVFPFFLFAVGNALSFSIGKYAAAGTSTVLRKILTRTVLIFGIGLLLNWFPFFRLQEGEWVFKTFDKLRIFGVLQRIALAYMGAALIVSFTKPRQAFWIAGGLLLAYWGILLGFGDLTLEGNAVRKLDLWLLDESHLYHGYFSEILNQNIAFDPEGLLSFVPAVSSVIFGFLVGKFIRDKGNTFEMLTTLFVLGSLSLFVGLCWHMVFPINKPIWSSSYVLHTTGLAMTLLAVIIYLVDTKGYKGWTSFFVIFGKNPLFIFVLAGVVAKLLPLIPVGDTNFYGWLYRDVLQPLAGDYLGSLVFALLHVLFFWFISLILDRKKIYIRV